MDNQKEGWTHRFKNEQEFLKFLKWQQTQTPVDEKNTVSPQKFLETYEGFDFEEAFTDNELEHITNAMSSYHKSTPTPVKEDVCTEDKLIEKARQFMRDKGFKGIAHHSTWARWTIEFMNQSASPAKGLDGKEDDDKELTKMCMTLTNAFDEEIDTAKEACMLIIGAYEGYQWERARSLEATASQMFEYAKAGYANTQPNKSNEAIEWISVDDKLPNLDEKVLVFGEAKGMNPQMGGAYIFITSRIDLTGTLLEKEAHRHLDDNRFKAQYVTYWMPLPKKPANLFSINEQNK